MTRYIDMTSDERRARAIELAETRVIIEGCRSPSRRAVQTALREEMFLVRVAKSRGDAWAQCWF